MLVALPRCSQLALHIGWRELIEIIRQICVSCREGAALRQRCLTEDGKLPAHARSSL